MRIPILSILAAVALAGPALGQANSYTGIRSEGALRPQPAGIDGTIGLIDRSIHDGRHSGQLTHKQAKALRRDGARIEALQARYGADWLSPPEQAQLEAAADALSDQVIAARTLPPPAEAPR